MRIVVTGGAGFIGSNLVRHLLQHTPWHVHVIDKLTYAGNRASLRACQGNPRFALSVVDICDRPAVQRILSDYCPSAIMHLAAESHVDRSIDAPDSFIQTNLVGTFQLLAAARSYCASLNALDQARFRFLHVSTDEVFGSLDLQDPPTTEQAPYAPSSPYSASKAGADHLVRAWSVTYRLPVLITNCCNNYGPFQFPEKFIPLAILKALRGEPIPVYGSGENIRDWLFVEDHVEALIRVLTAGVSGETYHVGARTERTNLQIVTNLCHILDQVAPRGEHGSMDRLGVSYANQITLVPDRPGHDFRYGIDPSKLERELGWQPRVSLESGLRTTIEWYLSNREWWEDILSGRYQLERLGKVPADPGSSDGKESRS